VARALAARPEIIFGDEPTGNLDSRAGAEVLGFLRRSVDELGQTIVMVTHDLDEAVSLSDRVIVFSSPPSRVILDHRVDIPRPRDVFTIRETPAFAEHAQVVWRVLGEEFRHTSMMVGADASS
jgi:NitT/TauT family transport system ATP-binding protein